MTVMSVVLLEYARYDSYVGGTPGVCTLAS